jgi:hypothetical protein
VAEVRRDEARVACLLPQPRGGGMSERVRSHALVNARALGGATDDQPEDRRLQPSSLESAEDGAVRRRPSRGTEADELARERRR